MATQAWVTDIGMQNDADFRAWGLELSTKFQAAGLVQTADTGQINWTTVTKPGASTTVAGYEVYKLNDSLDGSAPIRILIEYGTANSATQQGIWFTVGAATDGAGVITGTKSTRVIVPENAITTSGAGTYPSYCCVTEGFFGLAWKWQNANSRFITIVTVGRTTDNTGAITADGFYVSHSGGTGNTEKIQCVRLASPATVFNDSVSHTVFPGLPTGSALPNGDTQVYTTWGNFPDVRPLKFLCGIIRTELVNGVTFSTILVGTTSHTYLSLSGTGHPVESVGSGLYGIAMLYE